MHRCCFSGDMISRPVMLYLPREPGVFGAAFQLFVLLDLHGKLSSSVLLADVLVEGPCLPESTQSHCDST